MMRLLKALKLVTVVISLFTTCLYSFDTAHFFRPPFFFGEPRFEKPLLSSLLIEAAHGSSSCARNCSGKKVPLLDILPEPTVSLASKIDVTELVIDWCQNFTHGFFFETQIPFRMLKLDPVPISKARWCERGIGDPGLALGWTRNYENTELLDFIDTTLRFGVLLPLSKPAGVRHLFDIPLGNNGHTGFFGIVDLSVGIYDWVTFGAHASVLGFLNAQEQLRIATDNERGLFATQKISACMHRGTIYDAGLYCKADHFVMGLSLLFGYQYQRQQADRLARRSSSCNHPTGLLQWHMHTWHTQIEYDFATEEHPHAPRIGLLWNHIITGKRIFLPSMCGGYLGFDICWCW